MSKLISALLLFSTLAFCSPSKDEGFLTGGVFGYFRTVYFSHHSGDKTEYRKFSLSSVKIVEADYWQKFMILDASEPLVIGLSFSIWNVYSDGTRPDWKFLYVALVQSAEQYELTSGLNLPENDVPVTYPVTETEYQNAKKNLKY